MSDREIEAALRQIRPDKTEAFPLGALNGIRVLRGYLEELEPLCIERSLDLGASVGDVADIEQHGILHKQRGCHDCESPECTHYSGISS